MKPRLAIYWDVQNVRISPEKIKLLNQWLNQKGQIVLKKAYAYWRKENEKLEKLIYRSGFEPINIPSARKNAVDKKIIQDCQLETLNNPGIEIIILMTGDKDYLGLIKNLKSQGKIVIILAHHNVQITLKNQADQFYNIDDLFKIEKLNLLPNQTNSSSEIISYEEAKHCLIAAIKMAQVKGKRAILSRVSNLMQNNPHFSHYQKGSLIRKPDGKNFSKFSKFVDAVIQEGIIQNRNGELILVTI